MTAAAERRRVGREKRREAAAGARQNSEEDAGRGDSRNEIAVVGDSLREGVRLTSPRAAAFVGAAGCVVAGVAAAAIRKKRKDENNGNTISGDVAVHLLNRIELLTIRLQVRHARRGAPAEIDVHRIEADASSRS